MRIHVVTPVTTPGLSPAADFDSLQRVGVSITQGNIERGPATIESSFDEVFAIPDTVRMAAEAVASGADAVVIDCMTDPGLAAAREATGTLVLGPAQSAMHVASMLALNFSVISASQAVLPVIHGLVAHYGLRERFCSARSVDIPVHELGDADRLGLALCAEALLAVEEDGAHAIVLGCTGMHGWSQRLHNHLSAHGHPGIPVVDPVAAAIKLAEALVDLGLRPSTRTYAAPLSKPVIGYDDVVAAVRFDVEGR